MLHSPCTWEALQQHWPLESRLLLRVSLLLGSTLAAMRFWDAMKITALCNARGRLVAMLMLYREYGKPSNPCRSLAAVCNVVTASRSLKYDKEIHRSQICGRWVLWGCQWRWQRRTQRRRELCGQASGGFWLSRTKEAAAALLFQAAQCSAKGYKASVQGGLHSWLGEKANAKPEMRIRYAMHFPIATAMTLILYA